MIGAAYSFFLLFAGYVLIFLGIAFANKVFLPSIFEDFYSKTNFPVRVFLMSLIFAFPANILISQSFNVTSASIAGPLLLAAVLILTTINAMILDKVQLTLPIIGAASGALFFCCLTAWLLEGQRAAG